MIIPFSFLAGPAAAAGTAFVTNQVLGTLRSDFTGEVGMGFTVGASPITISQLGRWVVSGNSATHTVTLYSGVIGGPATSLGAVSIATSGALVGFKYGTLGTPQTLTALTRYFILCGETNGGDQWYNDDTVLTTTAAAVCNGSVYLNSGLLTDSTLVLNHAFVPVTFKY